MQPWRQRNERSVRSAEANANANDNLRNLFYEAVEPSASLLAVYFLIVSP
jgi:hypothetical protein